MTEEEKSKAVRWARTIASDIALYNEAKILEGVQRDSLYELLGEDIEEGRILYRNRVGASLDAATNFFDRAIVDLVLRPKGTVKSPLW
ncbi:MAG: hypothetical protein FJ086_14605 [Deltaproteobacteria bacterium]|nr:hypothetical protein [Deltaproteobacteria bacterium]